MSDFQLHERLQADTTYVTDLPVCRVLLMNDARYPWLILVPRRPGMRDLDEIDEPESAQVFAEVTMASRVLKSIYDPFKLNVAALGNQVPQLHIHIIARTQGDSAWPAPVWGIGDPIAYKTETQRDTLNALREAFVTG